MSKETTYRTIANYQLAKSGYITKHQGELALTLFGGDALDAAQIALDAVRVVAGPSNVTNLQLRVAIGVDRNIDK